MKKWIACLLVLALLCCGCSNRPSASKVYQLYRKAFDKTMELKTAEYDIGISMVVDGSPLKAKSHLITDASDPEKYQMHMSMQTDMGDMKYTTDTYYTDGYLYMKSLIGQYKIPATTELAQQQASSRFFYFEVADIGNGTVSTEDKTTTIAFTVSRDNVKSMLDGLMTALLSALELSDGTISYSDVSTSITIDKDGYMTRQLLSFTVTMNVQEKPLVFDCELDNVLVNRNSDVQITFPDFSNYTEISQ